MSVIFSSLSSQDVTSMNDWQSIFTSRVVSMRVAAQQSGFLVATVTWDRLPPHLGTNSRIYDLALRSARGRSPTRVRHLKILDKMH